MAQKHRCLFYPRKLSCTIFNTYIYMSDQLCQIFTTHKYVCTYMTSGNCPKIFKQFVYFFIYIFYYLGNLSQSHSWWIFFTLNSPWFSSRFTLNVRSFWTCSIMNIPSFWPSQWMFHHSDAKYVTDMNNHQNDCVYISVINTQLHSLSFQRRSRNNHKCSKYLPEWFHYSWWYYSSAT